MNQLEKIKRIIKIKTEIVPKFYAEGLCDEHGNLTPKGKLKYLQLRLLEWCHNNPPEVRKVKRSAKKHNGQQ